MELKEFVTKTIIDIVDAVNMVSKNSNREVQISSTNDSRSIEFDIAVSVEERKENQESIQGDVGAKIKVVGLFDVGGKMEGNSSSVLETKVGNVSRIKFGVHVDRNDKEQNNRIKQQFERSLPENFN